MSLKESALSVGAALKDRAAPRRTRGRASGREILARGDARCTRVPVDADVHLGALRSQVCHMYECSGAGPHAVPRATPCDTRPLLRVGRAQFEIRQSSSTTTLMPRIAQRTHTTLGHATQLVYNAISYAIWTSAAVSIVSRQPMAGLPAREPALHYVISRPARVARYNRAETV